MDPNKNVDNDLTNTIPSENAAVAHEQDISPVEAETKPCIRDFPPTKERVKILSVEYVQPALEVRQPNTQLEVGNLSSGMEVENGEHSYSYKTENSDKQGVFETLEKESCNHPDPKNSAEILTHVESGNKISEECIIHNQESPAGLMVCIEKNEIQSTVTETITDSSEEQISVEVTDTDKETYISVSETTLAATIREQVSAEVIDAHQESNIAGSETILAHTIKEQMSTEVTDTDKYTNIAGVNDTDKESNTAGPQITLADTFGEQVLPEVTDKDSKNAGPETNNEMEVIDEIFTNGPTHADNFEPIEACDSIDCHITNMQSSPLTPIEIPQKLNYSTPNRNGEETLDATTNSTNSLSLLAQYGSDVESNDSDSNSVIEVSASIQDYRSKAVETDSETDSDSLDSDVAYLNVLRKTIEKSMEIVSDDDDDEDREEIKSEKGIRKKPAPKIRAKGELQLNDLPPIEDLHITVPEDECIVLGNIHSIVDQLVLVSALPNSILVDLDSVLFLEKGQKVLGAVFDVLGQVNDPLYCVRFNSNKQINDKDIKVNDVVYLAPKTPYTQYIILSSIMRQKGSDASWEHDLEPPPRFLDYSDDEEQQQARRKNRNVERPMNSDEPQMQLKRESEEPQVPSVNKTDKSQPRHHYPGPTRGRGGAHRRGAFAHNRQQYNPHYRHPQVPVNHNPSSWHSNYYPQAYATMPPPNVAYTGGYPQSPAQMYTPVSMYQMGMPYQSAGTPMQYPMPPNNHMAEHQQQLEAHGFNIRPPTIPGHYDMPPTQPRNQ